MCLECVRSESVIAVSSLRKSPKVDLLCHAPYGAAHGMHMIILKARRDIEEREL
jgi:hypothetical protein